MPRPTPAPPPDAQFEVPVTLDDYKLALGQATAENQALRRALAHIAQQMGEQQAEAAP